MKHPLVSVIMATRNRAGFLKESVGSIVAQTYAFFEFLIVDDASSDGTPDVLGEYAARDPRVRVLRNDSNVGPAKSRNKALREAQGRYVAILDDTDIALPERLRLQVDFLENNPSYALVGSWVLEESRGSSYLRKLPIDSVAIKRALIFRNPFVHSTVMMRKEVLDKVGLYDERWKYAHDYELYFRIASSYNIANLPLVLSRNREAADSITAAKNKEQALFALKARQKALKEGLYPKSVQASLGIVRGYLSYLIPVSLKRMAQGVKRLLQKRADSYV